MGLAEDKTAFVKDAEAFLGTLSAQQRALYVSPMSPYMDKNDAGERAGLAVAREYGGSGIVIDRWKRDEEAFSATLSSQQRETWNSLKDRADILGVTYSPPILDRGAAPMATNPNPSSGQTGSSGQERLETATESLIRAGSRGGSDKVFEDNVRQAYQKIEDSIRQANPTITQTELNVQIDARMTRAIDDELKAKRITQDIADAYAKALKDSQDAEGFARLLTKERDKLAINPANGGMDAMNEKMMAFMMGFLEKIMAMFGIDQKTTAQLTGGRDNSQQRPAQRVPQEGEPGFMGPPAPESVRPQTPSPQAPSVAVASPVREPGPIESRPLDAPAGVTTSSTSPQLSASDIDLLATSFGVDPGTLAPAVTIPNPQAVGLAALAQMGLNTAGMQIVVPETSPSSQLTEDQELAQMIAVPQATPVASTPNPQAAGLAALAQMGLNTTGMQVVVPEAPAAGLQEDAVMRAGPSTSKSNSVTTAELRDLMYKDFSQAHDPKVSAEHRLIALQNAASIAQVLNGEGVSVPADLLDKNLVNRQMLSLGQQFLAEQRHAINGNIGVADDMKKALRFDQVERMIKELADAGLQSAQQSYAMFGGKEAFDKLKEQEIKLATAKPTARGFETAAVSPDVQVAQPKSFNPDDYVIDGRGRLPASQAQAEITPERIAQINNLVAAKLGPVTYEVAIPGVEPFKFDFDRTSVLTSQFTGPANPPPNAIQPVNPFGMGVETTFESPNVAANKSNFAMTA